MSFEELSASRPAGPIRFGPYLLQEQINAGGTAEIWTATNEDGEILAIRKLLDKHRFSLGQRGRFKNGADIHEQLSPHEFIIGFIENGKIDGSLYVAMEFFECSNLKLLLARQDEILGEAVGNILVDMAKGLDYIHDQGFMHLDFKPENVLVSRNGTVKLCDFDLSLPKPDAPKKFGKLAGTPVYMAPEQLRGEPFDQRADIFAYGVSAYELLTGQKPFMGESVEEIVAAHESGEIIAPRELNPDIPHGLESILIKCLAVDPNARYGYMSVLVRDLQTVLYVDEPQGSEGDENPFS
jgi:eukaryotic-like serine/threonine-protein kinase